jgi:4-hydroxy-3-polyprenylbenzoate decarboxylase
LKHWIVGITGASGAAYGVKCIEALLQQGFHVHVIITDAGWRVLHEELGWNAAQRQKELEQRFQGRERIEYHPNQDIGASIASGSFRVEGMVILPCSMGTLSAVSRGASDNLMERAADVMMKEGKPLVLVPRETPLHVIHLENMLTLARAGVKLIPAMPAFYYHPKTLDDIVSFVVGKVLDSMNIEHKLFTRWGE